MGKYTDSEPPNLRTFFHDLSRSDAKKKSERIFKIFFFFISLILGLQSTGGPGGSEEGKPPLDHDRVEDF